MNYFTTLTLAVTLIGQPAFGQLTFDDTSSLKFIYIDTVNYANNNWQVGKPQKTMFDSAKSLPNVLITDTINTYPTNDTSAFYLFHTLHYSPYWWPYIGFDFKINTDSLTDFGVIEASSNGGQTWVDIIKEASNLGFDWFIQQTGQSSYSNADSIPFTGSSNVWYNFQIIMSTWDYLYGYNDTILFRFTFISDSLETNKDGWMIDNIYMGDVIESVQGSSNNKIKSTVFPNPYHDFFIIKVENDMSLPFDLTVTDIVGKIAYTQNGLTEQTIKVDIKYFPSGLYYYHLSNPTDNTKGDGKIIKN